MDESSEQRTKDVLDAIRRPSIEIPIGGPMHGVTFLWMPVVAIVVGWWLAGAPSCEMVRRCFEVTG